MGSQIIGVGCDIVDISRINKSITKFGAKFLKKIFTEYERLYAPGIDSKLYITYFAKRFAAKEACVKALGIGIGEGLSFCDIEIFKDTNGRPCVRILNENFYSHKFHISLSDDGGLAVAYVIAEKVVMK